MATTINKQMRTETSHLLPGHPGRCRNIHGHSYLWEVALISEQLQFNGMVEDFGDLKKRMVEIIDPFDHAFVFFTEDDASCVLVAKMMDLGIERVVAFDYPPTAENFAWWVHRELKRYYPTMGIRVRVWETATSWAEYADPKA